MPRRESAEPVAATLGARIRALRIERGMSLAGLADASGLSKGTLSGIERGLTLITIRTLAKIARGLNMTSAALLTFPVDGEFEAMLDVSVSPSDA